jgi:2-keto-myo-inositol isomerase
MTVASIGFSEAAAIAAELGCVGIEVRNDLDHPLFDGQSPEAAAAELRSRGLRLLSVAELRRFNEWNDDRAAEALDLIDIASRADAEAISLIPRNDNGGLGNGERQANLRVALRELKPMLDAAGLLGFVEPLGFQSSSLRFKSEVAEVIDAMEASSTFRLIHDTFHHHIAGGGPVLAGHTGLVHISGVTDGDVAASDMTDAHRVLIDRRDRLANLDQIAALMAGGYDGPVSFEAFAPEVHSLVDPKTALAASMEFIRAEVHTHAA